jgi:hypothetical protein
MTRVKSKLQAMAERDPRVPANGGNEAVDEEARAL